MPLGPGSVIGPYEILASLGAGGMGEVWKARDTRLNRLVAIKRLNVPHASRFQQEAQAIAALNHPHICQIHDVGPDYLVLEYIDGEPLHGPLPPGDAIQLAMQVASALEEAHSRGFVHLDLKPANILVTPKHDAKLLDFGIAKLLSNDSDATRTADGAVLGTAPYMSPEQAEGRLVDARSDIFSLGAVLYELLSGRRAFDGETLARVLSAIEHDEPPPLAVASSIDRIVRRCLAKRAEDRFQTATDLRRALEQIARDTHPPADTRASIAVLPFANMSADPDNEYFSDGLAEEIINALTHVAGLKVIARTSAFAFKGKHDDIRRIADVLSVAHVLEGSVRKAGSRIRVTAQLITASDGSHLWSERYDRDLEDVFAVQDEIAQAITDALAVRLAPERVGAQRPPLNMAAYEAYLKARYYFEKLTADGLPLFRRHIETALALDPEFAPAHVLLGTYFIQMAIVGGAPAHEVMPQARAAALKALTIAPLPEAHALLGVISGLFEYDWTEAGNYFARAMALEPVSPLVRQFYGYFHLIAVGRAPASVQQHRRALQEDPLNVRVRLGLAASLANAGNSDEARDEFRAILEIDPQFPYAHLGLAGIDARRGAVPEAIDRLQRRFGTEVAAGGAITNSLAFLVAGAMAGLRVRLGDDSEASRLRESITGNPTVEHVTHAGLYLWSGDIERAADSLERAIAQRAVLAYFLLFTLVSPSGPALRASARWPRLAQMMNLPQTVHAAGVMR